MRIIKVQEGKNKFMKISKDAADYENSDCRAPRALYYLSVG